MYECSATAKARYVIIRNQKYCSIFVLFPLSLLFIRLYIYKIFHFTLFLPEKKLNYQTKLKFHCACGVLTWGFPINIQNFFHTPFRAFSIFTNWNTRCFWQNQGLRINWCFLLWHSYSDRLTFGNLGIPCTFVVIGVSP